jgi:hypothetical protein
VNIAICLRGASDPDPAPVYVDQRALRNDRVTLVEKGSPHSLCLLESGKVSLLNLIRFLLKKKFSFSFYQVQKSLLLIRKVKVNVPMHIWVK